jgi:hypothetical protein
MAILYRVADWDRHFEKNRTRELKSMTWLSLPTKMDGDGYTQLVEHPNGAAHYGAWIAIVLIASKCDPRGTLVRSSAAPHCSRSLARISRLDPAVFDEALPRLVDIGWLTAEDVTETELATISQEGAAKSHTSAPTGPEITGPEITEQDITKPGENRTAPRRDSGSGIFKDLDLGVLRDGRKLMSWFIRALGTPSPPFADTPLDRLRVFGAAQRAVEIGKNPAALFAAIVGKRQWEKISNAQEDRGRAELRKAVNGTPPRTSNLDDPHDAASKSRTEQERILLKKFGSSK